MNKENLKKEIEIELQNLERLNSEMEKIVDKIGDTPDFIEMRAAASVLHDFYCGVEKIFKRIALQIDGKLPKGEDWHIKLLIQMAHPIKGIREEIIDMDLLGKLKEYLRFRHLFRHIYGFELNWVRFKDLALSLSIILKEFKIALEKFKSSV